MQKKFDLYEIVTTQIVSALEKAEADGTSLPWSSGYTGVNLMPISGSGRPYRGINIPILWLTALEKGYTGHHWLTFKKINELGGHVKNGEHSTIVVFWNPSVKIDENGNEKKQFFLRYYKVFNVDQTENLPSKYYASQDVLQTNPDGRIELLDNVFSKIDIKVEHSAGIEPGYVPSLDFIQMPNFGQYQSAESYYATRIHEYVHATGAKKRLGRENAFGNRFGDKAYAFEELVAELGSAFFSAHIGLTGEASQNNIAYLQDWIQVLREDKRSIFTAASKAQQACDWLLKNGGVISSFVNDDVDISEAA